MWNFPWPVNCSSLNIVSCISSGSACQGALTLPKIWCIVFLKNLMTVDFPEPGMPLTVMHKGTKSEDFSSHFFNVSITLKTTCFWESSNFSNGMVMLFWFCWRSSCIWFSWSVVCNHVGKNHKEFFVLKSKLRKCSCNFEDWLRKWHFWTDLVSLLTPIMICSNVEFPFCCFSTWSSGKMWKKNEEITRIFFKVFSKF